MPDHAAALTELLGLVDERYQSALHAGIARLPPARLTPSPRQRAEAIIATQPWPPTPNDERLVEEITTAIQAANNETLERGRKRAVDVQAALQAALEDLARVTKERDAIRDEIRCVRLRAQSAEGLARMAEQRQSRLEMELAASRAGHRTTQGCYETELSARKAAEQERDGLAAALKKTKDQCYASICSVDEEQRRGGVFANPLLAVSARFALATIDHEDPATLLAAHDRQVAARVLREAGSHVLDGLAWDAIKRLADAYETGEREVPDGLS